jgi:hypothetical protein
MGASFSSPSGVQSGLWLVLWVVLGCVAGLVLLSLFFNASAQLRLVLAVPLACLLMGLPPGLVFCGSPPPYDAVDWFVLGEFCLAVFALAVHAARWFGTTYEQVRRAELAEEARLARGAVPVPVVSRDAAFAVLSAAAFVALDTVARAYIAPTNSTAPEQAVWLLVTLAVLASLALFTFHIVARLVFLVTWALVFLGVYGAALAALVLTLVLNMSPLVVVTVAEAMLSVLCAVVVAESVWMLCVQRARNAQRDRLSAAHARSLARAPHAPAAPHAPYKQNAHAQAQ